MEKEKVIDIFLSKGYTVVDNNLPQSILEHDKLTIKDSEGYYYYTNYNNIQTKIPKRYLKHNPYSILNMKHYLSKHCTTTLLSNKYIGYNQYYDFKCGICGKHFKKVWSDVVDRHRCYCHSCMMENHSKKHPIEFVDNKLSKYGYKRLSKYMGNNDSMDCIDEEGYKVKVKLTQLGVKQPLRFSTAHNEENYINNINHYLKINDIDMRAISYSGDKTSDYPNLLCKCSCGNMYYTKWSYIQNNQGFTCPSCYSKTSSYEHKVEKWLQSKHIEYYMQYKFEDCRAIRPLPFDFYLPKLNCCIEVDGIQHYEKIRDMDDEDLIKRQGYDNIKTKYCQDNNIKLIRIKYTDIQRRCEAYKTILYNELIKK